MTSDAIARAFLWAFVGLFFLYLFGPLIVMGVTAFNSASFPRVSPFECFTVEWFGALAADEKLLGGLANSVLIGLGVVALAVPIGLAAALLMNQVPQRARPWYYALTISPILIPGVVLGIATLVFWDRLGRMFGAGEESLFYDGIFLTIIGQTTFVAAYSLLIFGARLQRFDPAQEEAARDLGATPGQSFRRVLLPFLKPAIGSAAVLAFLASFENYNTTVFTSLTTETLVTVLAGQVRYGINPSISALAVLIIGLTLVGAVAYEIVKRREAREASSHPAAGRRSRGMLLASPALGLFLLIAVAGVGTTYLAGTVGVAECKAEVQAEKRRRAQERLQSRPPGWMVEPTEKVPDLFSPENLAVPRRDAAEEAAEPDPPPVGDAPLFAPDSLAPDVERPAPSGASS